MLVAAVVIRSIGFVMGFDAGMGARLRQRRAHTQQVRGDERRYHDGYK